MADSSLATWLEQLASAILAGIVSGISGAMAWFRRSKAAIHQRINDVEDAMRLKIQEVEDITHIHTTDLAVVKTNQTNHLDRLDLIQEMTRDTNQKVDALARTLTDVLLEIKHRRV